MSNAGETEAAVGTDWLEELPMNYQRIVDLNEDTTQLAQSLPCDIDLVVSLPQSGLFPANLLCLKLNTLMTDLVGLRERRLIASGARYRAKIDDFDNFNLALVVDIDNSNQRLTNARAELAQLDLPFDVVFAAIYVNEDGRDDLDHWGEVVEPPRLFEWSLPHNPILERSCVDIDGVLCRDPTPEENDDGHRYRRFLRTVEPHLMPTRRIGWLVTNRLERYREETEKWLIDQGILYDELVMADYENKAARQASGGHGTDKAKIYRSVDADLFVESDPRQATTIAELSGKPALSVGTNELIKPGQIASTPDRSSGYLSRLTRHPVAFAETTARYVLSSCFGAVHRHSER